MRSSFSVRTFSGPRMRRSSEMVVGASGISYRSRLFQQAAWQVAMPMHHTAHDYFVVFLLVEKHMFSERPKDNKESPIAQARMVEANLRAELRMMCKEIAGSFHSVEVPVGYILSGILHVPFELSLK